MLIDQYSVAQPSLEKLPPAENGNKCTDPRLGNVQRVRELGILGPKCDSTIISSPRGQETL